MKAPSATYRLQLNPSFGFEAAREVVAYLAALGIDTIYASPIFKARASSTHGYDVTDPNQINPELGTAAEFLALVEEVNRLAMGWLQDFVPNHMAYDKDNRLLMDVFEKGPGSPYFDFFDVVWDHLRENLQGKLIAPFLGRPYGEALERGELSLAYGRGGYTVNYYETVYPIRIDSYATIISYRLDVLKERLGEEHPDYIKMLGIVNVLRNLGGERGAPDWRNAEIRLAKELLWEIYQADALVRGFLDENVSLFNQHIDLLDRLLLQQWFRLSHWRVATKEINYQRFFNINELISLRMEEEAVFAHIHRLALALLAEGKISGLRVDHVDGLYDPTKYLARLRAAAPAAYLVVEKILGLDERLPESWPVEGTTGYDFLNYVTGLFVEGANAARFQSIYEEFAGSQIDYEELLVEKKKLIIERHLTGDLDNLTYLLKKISTTTRDGIDLAWIGLKRALLEVAARFPVYRAYMDGGQTSEQDRGYINQAIAKAKSNCPELGREMDFVGGVLGLSFPDYIAENSKGLWVGFVMRFQQFTSPLMAKGLEDTTFYVYNRLVSLNEVGGAPSRFGISPEEFHRFNLRRLAEHPRTLNATATHDTKRGEDTRARINVLSEMPDQWASRLAEWHGQNRHLKKSVGGEAAPDKNREYFLYQTLVGAYPFAGAIDDLFIKRIKEYVIKAARESKTHTFWLDPDDEYEEALLGFTEAILTPATAADFLASFTAFQKRVAHYGIFNSLAQLLLKITSVGLPDFYQGSELWDLSLVDPDNRRPVDYRERGEALREIKRKERAGAGPLIEELLSAREDGRVKMFAMYRALKARRDAGQLFDDGDYLPLDVKGERSNHLAAFARRKGDRWAIVLAPRLLTAVIAEDELPLGKRAWLDTSVALPEGSPISWRDAFTDEVFGISGRLSVSEAFARFPLGLLIGE